MKIIMLLSYLTQLDTILSLAAMNHRWSSFVFKRFVSIRARLGWVSCPPPNEQLNLTLYPVARLACAKPRPSLQRKLTRC